MSPDLDVGLILGLTGTYAAGKGTVASLLDEEGFRYHSLSDLIREELAARGVTESREALLAVGNELRRTGGPGVLAERLVERLSDGGRHIVDSIRNPKEVEALRRLPAFVLVAVDADPRVRYARLRQRARIGDPESWEAFRDLEARESTSDDPTTQQLVATRALADAVLQNDGSVVELAESLATLLAGLTLEGAATGTDPTEPGAPVDA